MKEIRLPAAKASDRALVNLKAVAPGAVSFQGPHRETGEYRVMLCLENGAAAAIVVPDQRTAAELTDVLVSAIRAAVAAASAAKA
jgi:hypothetical protein